MREISIVDARYLIVAVERDGQWIAHAERADTGDRFGIECGGSTQADAFDRLERWLEWQNEHTAALAALQRAERWYHRTIAGSAFANPSEDRPNCRKNRWKKWKPRASGSMKSARANRNSACGLRGSTGSPRPELAQGREAHRGSDETVTGRS